MLASKGLAKLVCFSFGNRLYLYTFEEKLSLGMSRVFYPKV